MILQKIYDRTFLRKQLLLISEKMLIIYIWQDSKYTYVL